MFNSKSTFLYIDVMAYTFGKINAESKKNVLNLRVTDRVVLVDKVQAPAMYTRPIVVLLDEQYSEPKMRAIQLFLESAGVTRYLALSTINCHITKEAIKEDQREGLVKFYRDNSSAFRDQIDPGSVVLTSGAAVYALTRSDDVFPVYAEEFIFGKASFQYQGLTVFPMESFAEIFARGFTQGAVDSYKTRIAQFQCGKAVRLSKEGLVPERPFRLDLRRLQTQADFDGMIESIDKYTDTLMAIDLETSGFHFMDAEIGCMTLSFDGRTGYFIPWSMIDSESSQSKSNKETLEVILYRNRWLGSNLKFDVKFLWKGGFSKARVDEDVVALGHTLDETRSNSLKTLAYLYSSYGGYDSELEEYKRKTKIENYLDIPIDILWKYATMDVIVTWQVFQGLLRHCREIDVKYPSSKKNAEHNTFESYYKQIRIPAINLYAKMEYRGVCIDKEKLAANRRVIQHRIEEIEAELCTMFGVARNFDFGSTTTLGRLLKELGWENLGSVKAGHYKTADDQLSRWAKTHPEAEMLQELRTCRVILNTFMGDELGTKGWSQYIKVHADGTYRMHPDFNVMGADTGRQKCRSPNMQNPPAHGLFAKEVVECITVPDTSEAVLATLDYSGLQLRLATIDGEDPELMPLYARDRNADIHSKTAYGIFAKNVSFQLDCVEVEQDGRTYNFLAKQLVKTGRGDVAAENLVESDVLL